MRRRKRDTIRGVTLAVVVGLMGSVVVPPPRVPRCATVPVPVDYRAPEGEQIEIMISRPATDLVDKDG